MQKPSPASDRDEEQRLVRRLRELIKPREIRGWFGDLGRLAWGFPALNFRKTLFRRGRGRFRCPCQNPSDSGRAGQTGCDAMLTWANPARFRRLCPLLRQMPDGEWRCTVDAADVRPFWGRALGYTAGAGLGLYLVGTLAVLVFFRMVGFPVNYVAVAWPPSWHEIDQARARFYLQKAELALRENKPIPAVMALSQSYQLDPKNYSAGRLLAQLSQAGWSDNSSRIYQQLMRDYPAQRGQTAVAWFQALLTRGDFSSITKLAAERVINDPVGAPAWLNALIFASRQTGEVKALQQLAQPTSGLPPYMRQMCALELAFRRADPAETRRLLRLSIEPSPAPLFLYYWVDRQDRAGLADEALAELNRHGAILDGPDRLKLLLSTYEAEGWQTILYGEVDRLLAVGASPGLVELLCAHLIRHPDSVLLEKLFDAVYRHPLPADSNHLGVYTSLFCAAGAAGDWVRLQAAAGELKAITGTRFTALDSAETFFRGESSSQNIQRCLRSLPGLPIDVTYALYEYSDRRGPVRNLPSR